jgi:hypothetical protein
MLLQDKSTIWHACMVSQQLRAAAGEEGGGQELPRSVWLYNCTGCCQPLALAVAAAQNLQWSYLRCASPGLADCRRMALCGANLGLRALRRYSASDES